MSFLPNNFAHCTQHTAHCTLHTAHCTRIHILHTLHTLHTPYTHIHLTHTHIPHRIKLCRIDGRAGVVTGEIPRLLLLDPRAPRVPIMHDIGGRKGVFRIRIYVFRGGVLGVFEVYMGCILVRQV